jgi:peptidyl-prolyl cis-trans isomerase SurA
MARQFWKSLFAVLLGVALLAPTAAVAPAQDVGRIAAVVNDQPITFIDLDTRLRLALLSAGLPVSEEARQRFLPQVLRQLIDEKLQLAEARRAGVTVSEADVNAAIATIAGQNRLTPEQLLGVLQRGGVPPSALVDQITAQLAWRALVRQRFIPQISISEADIDEILDRLRSNEGKPEYLLAEIFLPVDQSASQAEVKTLADRIVSEIRRGAPFPAVARQFSQAAGAQNGGDMGWVLGGQLEPALDSVIQGMSPGQVSAPILTLTGYHILFLRDKRTVTVGSTAPVVHLYQLVVPVPPNSPNSQVQAVAAQVQSDFGAVSGCEAFQARARQVGVPGSIDAGQVPVSRLPQEAQTAISGLADGQISAPTPVNGGVAVFMVCERTDSGAVDRDAIRNQIGEQRLDIMQRRLMRDLRAMAFIDMRL